MDSERNGETNGDKTGENTVVQTGGQTTRRRRRRFPAGTPDTPPTIPVEAAEDVDKWAEKDRRGFFSGRPGPGRGHTLDGAKVGDNGAEGVGGGRSKRPDVDLIAELLLAVQRRGPKFFDELLKASPVAASQLLASLTRNDPAAGAPGGEQVRIVPWDGMAEMAASIMAPPTGADLSGLSADELRAEVARLQTENADLSRKASGLEPIKPEEPDKPLLAVPSKEAVPCFSCEHRTPVKGRMIEPLAKCPFCGQTYEDSVAMRFTPPAPDPGDRPGGSVAFSIPLDGGEPGWAEVKDLSMASIKEAMDRPLRGPF